MGDYREREQIPMAQDLQETERKFAVLYDSMTEGVALHDVVYDTSGKPIDYILADVNLAFERITGLSRKEAVGKKASELYGTGEPPYLGIVQKWRHRGNPLLSKLFHRCKAFQHICFFALKGAIQDDILRH